MTDNFSPLAIQRPAYRKRRRKMKPWGLLVHTSGRGIVERSEKRHMPAIILALDWYRQKGGVHYVIGYDGKIYQMQPDNTYGAHVGISIKERLSYLTGRWVKKVDTLPLKLWYKRWPKFKTPQHLYPTRSPNGCYVGVEMVPLAKARPDGTWFTDAQHLAVGKLARDLRERHGWPYSCTLTPRLLGHEDVDAFARWQEGGGWDPGAMRPVPRFDWSRIWS